jgi:hypothetical protein
MTGNQAVSLRSKSQTSIDCGLAGIARKNEGASGSRGLAGE